MIIEADLFDLSHAIKQIEDYQRKLESGNQELVKRLAEEGNKLVRDGYSRAASADNSDVRVNPVEYKENEATISAEGSQILFTEFGAGIYYNGGESAIGNSPHPLGKELGYTIGDYGKKQGRNDSWHKPDGSVTHGTQASRTMYETGKTLRSMVVRIAKEVFGK